MGWSSLQTKYVLFSRAKNKHIFKIFSLIRISILSPTVAAYHWDNDEKYARLSDKTLCMQGVHLDGQLHYNVHNLYGHYQTIASLE